MLSQVEDFKAAVAEAADTYPGVNKMTAFTPLAGMSDAAQFIPLIIPVAIQSFIETMENVEPSPATHAIWTVLKAGETS